jgi:hypothetical protein
MSTIKANTIETSSGGAITLTKQSAAKVWCFANASAVVQESLNISSGTDHATGDFSYALTNAYASANKNIMAASTNGTSAGRMITSNSARKTASVIALEIETHAGAVSDLPQEIIGNGDLA